MKSQLGKNFLGKIREVLFVSCGGATLVCGSIGGGRRFAVQKQVRPRGLEPPRDYLPLGPQPSASASSATAACVDTLVGKRRVSQNSELRQRRSIGFCRRVFSRMQFLKNPDVEVFWGPRMKRFFCGSCSVFPSDFYHFGLESGVRQILASLVSTLD